jgi:putative ABC transport system permease protein
MTMYPGLTLPLLVIVGIISGALVLISTRRAVIRRLALRQVARRPTEAALVITGCMLGTAIIVGALIVGDTLGFSVRQAAYHTLGPVDERVVSTSPVLGRQVAVRLDRGVARSADVDGVLSARVQQAAALRRTASASYAEPRVLAWDVDFAQAARFGSASGPSGLVGPAPTAGRIVLNEPLAASLHVRSGQWISLFLSGSAHRFRVSRVIPESGLAGTGFGATENRNAYLPPGTLVNDATRSVTWISNRGGVESGNHLMAPVVAEVRAALGPLAKQVAIETPKKDVLRAANIAGKSLGSLFLMIGSFSIIAGALLLVNIFVMLGEERKGQLGMLRAAGLKRSGLVGAFTLEGAAYAAVATVLGVGVGIAVGRGVAFLAARIFSSWSTDGSGLDVTFAVSSTSLVNGAALGLVIALGTIIATSIRISRFNIIAAIRDLDTQPTKRARRRLLVVSSAFAVLFAVLSVPVVAHSQAVGSFLLPALALLCATPLVVRRFGKRRGYSAVSTAVLTWALSVNVLRPGIYDAPSMAVYVVLGSLLAFSAVVLLSENQAIVLRPLRPLIERQSENALAGRIGLAYPLAKRFRTGATLIMYTLIMLVLMLLAEIGGVLNKSIDSQVTSATAGYALRVDYNPTLVHDGDLLRVLTAGSSRPPVTGVVPMTSVTAQATDPGHRTTDPLNAVVVGVPAGSTSVMQFDKRLPGLTTDRAVWHAVATHRDYVVLDAFFGSTGGPAGESYRPGDTFTVTDPRTGKSERKTIVGILRNATVFYAPLNASSFPIVTSTRAVREQFASAATVSSALVRTATGVEPGQLASQLQARFLSASMVATPIASTVRRMFNANLAFFRLMQGFLALGLLVGITGLGVVMVRAVRERRRTIGILRALGFRSRTIEWSFLIESAFVAVEGVVLGAVLGILTTWLMYQKSAAFSGVHNGFPILWGTAAVMGLVTVLASLVATVGPAHRASRILPALATRVSN